MKLPMPCCIGTKYVDLPYFALIGRYKKIKYKKDNSHLVGNWDIRYIVCWSNRDGTSQITDLRANEVCPIIRRVRSMTHKTWIRVFVQIGLQHEPIAAESRRLRGAFCAALACPGDQHSGIQVV
jgi:hypothetical protein